MRWGQQRQQQSTFTAADKALAAGTAAFSMLLLSGLVLTGTMLALIVATSLLVIFSPVLVPTTITVALFVAGFVSSGGFGAAAMGVLAWMYRYLQTSSSSSSAVSSPGRAAASAFPSPHRPLPAPPSAPPAPAPLLLSSLSMIGGNLTKEEEVTTSIRLSNQTTDGAASFHMDS
ncbi:hypothetical protein BAE44_0001682 [Dichanthelium oligosanthes]|uniref:Oleosin n=1 Tax=Dichanthelium oligosanthes TaxID=888268 RepID=A0A1E5WIR5_9POAL|nr:hypothetical protein BAE44_0001682 [Dichanthelium oligosanthes]